MREHQTSLEELRRIARAARRRAPVERRAYNLPGGLVAEILRYQAERGLASETAAVRELLDAALTAKEGADGRG